MKSRNALLAAACAGVLGLNRLVMAQFIPGDLEVVTNLSKNTGGGLMSPVLDANAVAITQWNPTATGQTNPNYQVNLPTVTSGAQSAFYMDGNFLADGQLSLSTDGSNLVLGGWAGTFSTKLSGSAANPSVNRVVAVINASGSVDTSTVIPVYAGTVYSNGVSGTALTNYMSAFPAAVMSGNQIWVAGQASNPYEMGVMTTTFGSTAQATQIGAPNAGPVPTTLTIYNNQLYTSQQSVLAQTNASSSAIYPTQQALYGPATVGAGLPTTASTWTETYLPTNTGGTASNSYSAPTNPVTQLNGFGSAFTSVLGQADGFAFADGGATIYIGTTDGVEKWVNESGTWTELWQSYSGSGTNYDGLIASSVASLVVEPDPNGIDNDIYVTNGFNNTGDVIGELQDPNAANGGNFESSVPGTFSIIATAPAGEYFRGISFAPVAVPEPASLGLISIAGVGLLGRRRRV
jgi:hypothetical protein